MSDEQKPDQIDKIVAEMGLEATKAYLRQGHDIGTNIVTFIQVFKAMVHLIIAFYIMLALIKHQPLIDLKFEFKSDHR